MSEDYIIRATAANAQIRAFAATTRNMVEEARSRHNTSPVATAALGRLMTAGAIMGITMKSERDVMTLRINGDGPIGSITVTSDASGNVKGTVANPMVLIHAKPNGKLDVSGSIGRGTLTVIKDIGMKEPYTGQIDLVSGEIAEDITYYYAVSEQVPSCVGLGVLMNHENTVQQAGGFMIQLMPFAEESVISALEKKIASINSVTTMLDKGMSPEDILQYILGDMDLEILDKLPTRFYCGCNRENVKKAVISAGREEIEDMIREGKPIEVVCHFCNEHYEYSVQDLCDILGEC